MKLTIAELAKILKGEVIGDGNTSLINLAKIEEAKAEILHLYLIRNIYLGCIKLVHLLL